MNLENSLEEAERTHKREKKENLQDRLTRIGLLVALTGWYSFFGNKTPTNDLLVIVAGMSLYLQPLLIKDQIEKRYQDARRRYGQ